MKAIFYTSHTGHTQRYAQLLAERTGVPAYSMKEAREKLRPKDEIFYMGWLMAGTVKGVQAAMDRYTIRGAAIVGSRPRATATCGQRPGSTAVTATAAGGCSISRAAMRRRSWAFSTV